VLATVTAGVLVLAAVVLRTDSSTAAASEAPIVYLGGIPQRGRMLGSPAAKVTLVEYADAQCPACRAYTESVFPTVVEDYVRTGKVKTELRGYPFIGSDSVKGYRFLLAAGRQNKLWNLQDAFYAGQGRENSGWLSDDLVRRVASDIPGLDVGRLFADARSPAITREADSAGAAAEAAGIVQTPTLLVRIGHQKPYLIEVSTPDRMRAALDDALEG
jgi:protein-disulfide isomerase